MEVRIAIQSILQAESARLTTSRFYIVGTVWNVFVAVVIFFTYMETRGLTLEQIDQRFKGVPRDQLVDITQVYYGVKPITEGELESNAKLESNAQQDVKSSVEPSQA
jgi:hypothetical protein